MKKIQEQVSLTQWSGAKHSVQFYEADSFLINSILEFIGVGHTTVVIATREHQEKLRRQLFLLGIDVESGEANGSYLFVDVEKFMSEVILNGKPDRELFVKSVASVLDHKVEKGGQVRVFCEMVSVLWQRGDLEAAAMTEELWNEIQESNYFSLMCAYPVSSLGEKICVQTLGQICEDHAGVLSVDMEKPSSRIPPKS